MNFIAAPSPVPEKYAIQHVLRERTLERKKKDRKKGFFLLLRLLHGKVLPQHPDKQTTCDLQMLMCGS